MSDFTHLYADKPKALIKLCEFVFLVFRHLSRTPPGESDLYHTLLELYLSEQSEEIETGADYESADGLDGDGDAEQDRYEKALNLLREGWATRESPKYDSEHVLVLCRMHGFKKGLVFLYERKGLLREVLQVVQMIEFSLSEESHTRLESIPAVQAAQLGQTCGCCEVSSLQRVL